MSVGKAKVKAVLSGDTVVLRGLDDSRGPPPERVLSLASLAAPRLGNRNGTKDEPFAWASREFLRKKLIGQTVNFRVEYQNPSGTREFGTVFTGPDSVNVSALVVAEGWAKVNSSKNADSRAIELDDLLKEEQAAQAQTKGIWTTVPGARDAAVRDVLYGDYDVNALYQALKGTPQPAVVDMISGASSFKLLLLPSFHNVSVLLSGVQAPGIRRDEDGTEVPQPYAKEAKYFVESRLLHRDVKVMLEGVDKNGSLFGTILHDKGNISEILVKQGLAKVVEWSIKFTTSDVHALRMAEKAARESRLRVWKDHVAKQLAPEFVESQAKVLEAASGDTVIVVDADGNETRVSLSSIRAPRPGNHRAQDEAKRAGEPWSTECKEYLRKVAVGKKVRVCPEYTREFEQQDKTVTRLFGSVFLGDKNLAEMLVGQGLATVSRHNNTEERSAHYEQLLATETIAANKQLNIHSSGEPPKTHMNDLTLPAAKSKAKDYLSFLQREHRTKAIVEFVVNGARFKLRLPKGGCIVMFALAGVRCPRSNAEKSEPFAEEATTFSRHRCIQREVEIEVETIDKGGTFLGSMWVQDKSLSLTLLEAGIAVRNIPSAEYSPYASDLEAAESKAKHAQRKMWEDWSEEKEAKALEEATAKEVKDEGSVMEITVTEVIDAGHFWAHVIGEQGVNFLKEQLASVSLETDPSGDGTVSFKPGSLCCAQYHADQQWYRGRVVKSTATEAQVQFIDYGNTETVAKTDIKPLDPASLSVPAQAHEFFLSYLKVPELEEEYGLEAAHALSSMLWEKKLCTKVNMQQGKMFWVTVFEMDTQLNVNEEMIKLGLARVEQGAKRRAAKTPAVAKLLEQEEEARSKRLGMWEYGDVGDDDDAREFGAPAPRS